MTGARNVIASCRRRRGNPSFSADLYQKRLTFGKYEHIMNKPRNQENTQDLGTMLLSKEGLYNLCFTGTGVVALESYVPIEEIIEYELNDDILKIDGNMAICWSGSLKFTVEKSTRNLLGALASGEGFVNVYRGTGKVWVSPVSATRESTPQTMASNSTTAKQPASSGGLLGALLG